jgi:hypothetical protein
MFLSVLGALWWFAIRPLILPVNVVFDRSLDRVLRGRRRLCNLGSVVAVSVVSPRLPFPKSMSYRDFYLVFRDKDRRERRQILDRDGSEGYYTEVRTLLNEFLRASLTVPRPPTSE